MRYPLAKAGVYWSIQGEGSLAGVPMAFVRLAGCSVGCPLCDTDYRVADRATAADIADQVDCLRKHASVSWVWITGGEPTDHDLAPLLKALRDRGFRVAVATAGHRLMMVRPDFLSVSPHSPDSWRVVSGSELKIVPGVNGHSIEAFRAKAEMSAFGARYVQPCEGKPETVRQCVEWVVQNPGWRLSIQAHKVAGLA